MHERRLLVSWIGHTDLIAMANELPETDRQKVLDTLRARPNPAVQKGPIRTLVDAESFDSISTVEGHSR